MSLKARSDSEFQAAAPLSHGLATSPAEGLSRVILLGVPPSIAAHLMIAIRAVAATAEVQTLASSDLGSPACLPEGALLILADRQPNESGLDLLRRLRAEEVSTPAILVLTGDDFDCPIDFDRFGDLDVIPLAEFTRFSFRRSLILLRSRATQERVLHEAAGRLRAYERVLASKDEERLRVLKVAQALDRRLSTAESEFRDKESSWAERLARAEAYIAQPEQRTRELEGGAKPTANAAEASHRQLTLELAFHRDERQKLDVTISELRKICATQEQALSSRAAQQEQAGDLAARLEASERVRSAQTRKIASCGRRINELEQNLETIAALFETEQEAAAENPGVLLEELAKRLAMVERLRSQHQGKLEELSRNLAAQQVDDTLDHAQSRRDVLRRVDEAVQRARRLGLPLNCLMIGIDGQSSLRQHHGSLAFDFVLVQIAQRLQLTLRRRDVVMRYGEGEFLLLTDAESGALARSQGERLIRTVCAEPMELGAERVAISLSIAITPYRDEIDGAPELIRLARRALREAQANGERQILLSSGTPVDLPPAGREHDSGESRLS